MKPKTLAILVIVVVIAAVAYPTIRKSRERSQMGSAEFLALVERSYRQRVPFTPRPNTIVHKADIADGVLVFGVRIDNVNEGNVMESQRAAIRRSVTEMICEEEDATVLRERGMTVRASIGDRTGTPITTVAVLPNGC